MVDASVIVNSKAMDTIADLARRLAGPLADEIGMTLGDRARVYRLKNWVAVVRKTEKILEAAGLSAKTVPPRLLLPIVESSSLDDDEILQDLWAGLLGSASEESDAISPSYIETLKQLTPKEARALRNLFDSVVEIEGPHDPAFEDENPEGPLSNFIDFSASFVDDAQSALALETFERLGIIRRKYNLAPSDETGSAARLPSLYHVWLFTRYGRSFLLACQGPLPAIPQ